MQVVTCGSDRFNYKSEVPATLALDSVTFLEWLIELRNPVYSLDYWFMTKDMNNQPDEEIHRVKSQKELLSL